MDICKSFYLYEYIILYALSWSIIKIENILFLFSPDSFLNLLNAWIVFQLSLVLSLDILMSYSYKKDLNIAKPIVRTIIAMITS